MIGNPADTFINENNIAWESDIQYKFKNIEDVPANLGSSWEDVQWTNMTNGKKTDS